MSTHVTPTHGILTNVNLRSLYFLLKPTSVRLHDEQRASPTPGWNVIREWKRLGFSTPGLAPADDVVVFIPAIIAKMSGDVPPTTLVVPPQEELLIVCMIVAHDWRVLDRGRAQCILSYMRLYLGTYSPSRENQFQTQMHKLRQPAVNELKRNLPLRREVAHVVIATI